MPTSLGSGLNGCPKVFHGGILGKSLNEAIGILLLFVKRRA